MKKLEVRAVMIYKLLYNLMYKYDVNEQNTHTEIRQ